MAMLGIVMATLPAKLGVAACRLTVLPLVALAKVRRPEVLLLVPSVNPAAPWMATEPVKLAALDIFWPLIVPLVTLPLLLTWNWLAEPAFNWLLKLPVPATFNAPPRLVAPVPTLNVLVPVTAVLPFKFTWPVPVSKVPMPVMPKLPLAWL